jgi:hypothetical protein
MRQPQRSTDFKAILSAEESETGMIGHLDRCRACQSHDEFSMIVRKRYAQNQTSARTPY